MDKEVVMGFISVTDVLVSTFGLVAGAIAAHELFAISKLCSDKKKRREAEKKDSYKLLIELSQAKSSNEKASIFISLLHNGYVLNHKLVNAGGKYDDSKQQIKFQRFLTPVAVKKLNNIGGMCHDVNTYTI